MKYKPCTHGKEYKYKERAESSESLSVHSSCPQSEPSFLIYQKNNRLQEKEKSKGEDHYLLKRYANEGSANKASGFVWGFYFHCVFCASASSLFAVVIIRSNGRILAMLRINLPR